MNWKFTKDELPEGYKTVIGCSIDRPNSAPAFQLWVTYYCDDDRCWRELDGKRLIPVTWSYLE